ncbi:MAG: MBL fold metallo-hydrolase [Phycisphaeraceae bacterium]|nr:MBL fold metallo-hydrolase [Phycisphaeraceae bacterium]
MKLHFLGANRQVTGSRYGLEAGGLLLQIDCGLFQERAYLKRNWEEPPLPPDRVDAVLLTHAHLDHVGLLPRFAASGFRGPVYATSASIELADIVLNDSARIQVEDAEYKKRRHRREGRTGPHPVVPLYDEFDVERVMRQFRPVHYEQPLALNDRVTVTWREAGHILGAASLAVDITENGRTRRVVFSGDIGQPDKPIIRDPRPFETADGVVLESTYGDRDHLDGQPVPEELHRIVSQTVQRGGNLVIPTFAIERAQELIYHLGELCAADRIPRIPIYLDSPMAVSVTEVFRRHHGLFNKAFAERIDRGEDPFDYPNLHMVRKVEHSKAINRASPPAVIMAGSGMCTGGRIKHHLRHNLGREENTILFCGYQAHGTLGRQILEGEPAVRIHGKQWPVRARIERINGMSAHGDQEDLLRWTEAFEPVPGELFLTHGEQAVSEALAAKLADAKGLRVRIPEYKSQVVLP